MVNNVRRKSLALMVAVIAGCVWWLSAAPAWGKKIVLLMSWSVEPYTTVQSGFESVNGIRDVEVFAMEGKTGKGAERLKQCSAQDTAAVVGIGSEAVQAAKDLDPAIPLVYTLVLEPQTAVRQVPTCGLLVKINLWEQFAKIKACFPDLRRVGVMYNPAYSRETIAEARTIAAKNGLQLMPIVVQDQEDLETALGKITKKSTDLLWLVPDKSVVNPEALQKILRHSGKENLPVVGLSKNHVKMGAWVGFSADFYDLGCQTGQMVEEIMAGKYYPAVENPRKIIIYVNSKFREKIALPAEQYADIQYVE